MIFILKIKWSSEHCSKTTLLMWRKVAVYSVNANKPFVLVFSESLYPRKGFYELAYREFRNWRNTPHTVIHSVLNSTISCISQLGEVCPLLWSLGLHGQLCCTDFTPPILSLRSCSVVHNCGPLYQEDLRSLIRCSQCLIGSHSFYPQRQPAQF